MSQSGAVTVPWRVNRAMRQASTLAARHVRVTVIIALLLICGSLAGAALLQLGWERSRALTQAAGFQARRAEGIAADVGDQFSRYATLGKAFAKARDAESTAALYDAGRPALSNIVILDGTGQLLSQMKDRPHGLLPLAPLLLSAVRRGPQVVAVSDRRLALLFAYRQHIVGVLLDRSRLLRAKSLEEAVLASDTGVILDLGTRWPAVPPQEALDLGGARQAMHVIRNGHGGRLVALRKVPGWPLAAGASVSTGVALSSWYASLPLFLFFIFGPALAGAGLAVIFVREFERRARAAEVMRARRLRGSEEARLLIRLADAERRAAEAERSKSEFVAHMSHELRTPLNAIIGFSEIIAGAFFGNPGHPKYVEYACDIAGAGKALHTKIGDVLEFADLEAGRHPIQLAPVDAPTIARQVADEFAGRAFSRRIRLTMDLPDCGQAQGDGRAIQRVLGNLLCNALEYTPEGGGVHVTARRTDGTCVIAIADSGQGFSPEEQALAGRAFTRFDRPGAVTGVGMGLAIAMALARAMGGGLRLGGAPGQGTVAELRLTAL